MSITPQLNFLNRKRIKIKHRLKRKEETINTRVGNNKIESR